MDTKTIQTYNLMAKEYDIETKDFWDRFPNNFLHKFSNLVKKKVLDVGSGPGRDGLLLKQKGLEVICLDASSEMVKMSKARGLDSIVGDFKNLPFLNKTFDGVWSYTSLLHVPKLEVVDCIKEIYRVLKEEGIFALGLIEGESEEYRESSGVNMPRWFSFYLKEELEHILKNQGFKILFFEKIKPRTKSYLHFIVQKI